MFTCPSERLTQHISPATSNRWRRGRHHVALRSRLLRICISMLRDVRAPVVWHARPATPAYSPSSPGGSPSLAAPAYLIVEIQQSSLPSGAAHRRTEGYYSVVIIQRACETQGMRLQAAPVALQWLHLVKERHVLSLCLLGIHPLHLVPCVPLGTGLELDRPRLAALQLATPVLLPHVRRASNSNLICGQDESHRGLRWG